MDDTVLRIFSEELVPTLMTFLVICLEEEVEEQREVLTPFLKIYLEEEHKDLVGLEDREALTCCTKLLFRLKTY